MGKKLTKRAVVTGVMRREIAAVEAYLARMPEKPPTRKKGDTQAWREFRCRLHKHIAICEAELRLQVWARFF